MNNIYQHPSAYSESQSGDLDKFRRFSIGEFLVVPLAGRIESPNGTQHLEPKTVSVLICLARKQGRMVTKDDLFENVWPDTAVTEHVLTRCIYQLRKALLDDGKKQSVIQTVYKIGYRLLSPVSFDTEHKKPGIVTSFPNPQINSEFITKGIGYRQILSASSDHIYIFDRKCRYLFANPSGANALGLTQREMIGKHWRELGLVAEILEPFEAEVRLSYEKGLSFVEQVTYPTVFGDRTYEYSLTPICDDQGKIGCVFAIVRAITPR